MDTHDAIVGLTHGAKELAHLRDGWRHDFGALWVFRELLQKVLVGDVDALRVTVRADAHGERHDFDAKLFDQIGIGQVSVAIGDDFNL